MKNLKQFDQSDFGLLTDSCKWKLVCSELVPEAKQINDQAHSKWIKTHTDIHAQREILLALKGSTVCSLNGKSYLTEPGTVFLFDHFQNHDNGYAPSADGLKHLWIYLIGRKIIGRINLVKDHKMQFIGKDYILEEEHLFLTLQNTWDKLSDTKLPEQLKKQQITSALALILSEIAERDLSGASIQNENNHQARIITMIEEHIKETAGKGASIERLAKIAGYSKFHFLRIFRKNTGKRIHAFINEVRIRKVNKMIQEGYMKKEIADRLGFSCPAAFANWYKSNFN